MIVGDCPVTGTLDWSVGCGELDGNAAVFTLGDEFPELSFVDTVAEPGLHAAIYKSANKTVIKAKRFKKCRRKAAITDPPDKKNREENARYFLPVSTKYK
jgi:hypothetical protein